MVIATLDIIGPHILRYWKMKMPDKKNLENLKKYHMDMSKNGLGFVFTVIIIASSSSIEILDDYRLTKFVELRESMGLFRTRKQGHSIETIAAAVQRIRAQYPKAGTREMISLLFHKENMSVAR